MAIFTDLGAWWLLPLTVAAAMTGLLLFSAGQPLVASPGGATGATRSQRLPRRFWLFAAAVLLYGIAETLNGNWSGPYLTGERGVSAGGASFALTAFWAMVTIGRMLFAALSTKRTVRWIYAGLPVLLILAFHAILRVRGETGASLHSASRVSGVRLSSLSASVSADRNSGNSPLQCRENCVAFPIRRATGWRPSEWDRCEISLVARFD